MLQNRALAALIAPRLSFNSARYALSSLGIALAKTDFGEYRVNFKRAPESTAAYESDLPSAVDTARAMLAYRAKHETDLRNMGYRMIAARAIASALCAGV